MARQRERDDEDPRRPKPVARDGPYVMMLFTALAALITGCVLMYLDYDEYGKLPVPKEPQPKVQDLGTAAKLEPLPGATPPAPPGGTEPMPPGGMPPGGMPVEPPKGP